MIARVKYQRIRSATTLIIVEKLCKDFLHDTTALMPTVVYRVSFASILSAFNIKMGVN